MVSVAENLKNRFLQEISKVEVRQDQEVITLQAGALRAVTLALKKELKFDLLLDIVAIDWQVMIKPRFEVDYLFYKIEEAERVTLKVPVDNDANPCLDSIVEIFSAADWAEREVYDMMGIDFVGHPNLKRLLMWTDFQGHPLRKDYPIQQRQPIPVLDDIV